MSVTPRRRIRRESRRGLALLVVVASLAALGVTSAATSPSTAVAAPTSVALVGLSRESTAAFCGGLQHDPGVVESDVAVADLTASPRTLEVTTTNDQGRHSVREVAVRPGRVVRLDPAALLGGAQTAVSVVANGGGVAATEAIRGVDGTAVAPCLTQADPSWWLTGGSTARGESFELSVFNPDASEAIVTVSIVTPTTTGYVPVQSFEDVVLNPYQLATLSVHEVAPDQAPISALVQAGRGDVVVYGVGRATKGASSISLMPGSPSPSTDTLLPLLPTGIGVRTQLVVTNPSLSTIVASVRIGVALGCGSRCPALLTESIASDSTVFLRVSSLARERSQDAEGGEVVASAPGLVVLQRVTTSSTQGQLAPVVNPSTVGADHLVLVDPIGSWFDDVGIVNPGATTVTVELATVGASGPMSLGRSVVVGPHSSVAVPGGAVRRAVGGVVLLDATGPIDAVAQVHGANAGSGLLQAVPAN